MSAPSGQIPAGEEREPALKRKRPTEMARTGAIVVLVALITLFAVLNVEEVKVNWILGSGHAPLIIVIVISLLVGIVVSQLVERLARRRHRGES